MPSSIVKQALVLKRKAAKRKRALKREKLKDGNHSAAHNRIELVLLVTAQFLSFCLITTKMRVPWPGFLITFFLYVEAIFTFWMPFIPSLLNIRLYVAIYIPLSVVATLIFAAKVKDWKDSRTQAVSDKGLSFRKWHFVKSSIFLKKTAFTVFTIAFSYILLVALQALPCDKETGFLYYEGVLRAEDSSFELEYRCSQPASSEELAATFRLRAYALSAVVVLGGLAPLALIAILLKNRKRINNLAPRFLAKWGGIVNHYKVSYFLFEPLNMFYKVSLMCLAVLYSPEHPVNAGSLCVVLSFFRALAIWILQPHKLVYIYMRGKPIPVSLWLPRLAAIVNCLLSIIAFVLTMRPELAEIFGGIFLVLVSVVVVVALTVLLPRLELWCGEKDRCKSCKACCRKTRKQADKGGGGSGAAVAPRRQQTIMHLAAENPDEIIDIQGKDDEDYHHLHDLMLDFDMHKSLIDQAIYRGEIPAAVNHTIVARGLKAQILLFVDTYLFSEKSPLEHERARLIRAKLQETHDKYKHEFVPVSTEEKAALVKRLKAVHAALAEQVSSSQEKKLSPEVSEVIREALVAGNYPLGMKFARFVRKKKLEATTLKDFQQELGLLLGFETCVQVKPRSCSSILCFNVHMY